MIPEKLKVRSEIRESVQVGMEGDEKSPTLGNINISHASRDLAPWRQSKLF